MKHGARPEVRHALRSSRRGFSLVELSVVIGVSLVLLALLLPLMLNARKSAQTANCAANLRSIMVAYRSYYNEHEGIVAQPTANGAVGAWVNYQPLSAMDGCALAPYMSVRGPTLITMFRCPAQPVEDQVGYQNGTAYPLSYSMNGYGKSLHYGNTPAWRITRIPNPSTHIVIYDENQNADDDAFWYGTNRDTIAGRHGVITQQNTNINSTGPTQTQQGVGNVAYFDGHVDLATNNTCHTPSMNDPTVP